MFVTDDEVLFCRYKKPRKGFSFDFVQSKRKVKKWRYFHYSEKYFNSDITVTDKLPAQTNENILLLGNSRKNNNFVLRRQESSLYIT